MNWKRVDWIGCGLIGICVENVTETANSRRPARDSCIRVQYSTITPIVSVPLSKINKTGEGVLHNVIYNILNGVLYSFKVHFNLFKEWDYYEKMFTAFEDV
jgi:hypothetical protein